MNTRRLILVALLVAVGIFDYVHLHRRKQATAPAALVKSTTGAVVTPQVASAWSAYEQAAGQRDAAAAQFSPALSSFEAAKAQVVPTQGTYDAQDLDTCRMWLLQYRQGGSMKAMATHHIDDCATLHRDVAQ